VTGHDKGRAGFVVGQRVRVLDKVRPRQYGGRVGTVARVAHGELGVDFSGETTVDNLRTSAWFLPRELAPEEAMEEAIDSPLEAPGSPATAATGR
jgi:hypothetical protein